MLLNDKVKIFYDVFLSQPVVDFHARLQKVFNFSVFLSKVVISVLRDSGNLEILMMFLLMFEELMLSAIC